MSKQKYLENETVSVMILLLHSSPLPLLSPMKRKDENRTHRFFFKAPTKLTANKMLVECSPIKSNSPIYPVDLFAAFHGVKIAYCHYTLGRASAEPTRVSFPPQPWSGRGCINLVNLVNVPGPSGKWSDRPFWVGFQFARMFF